MDKTIIGQTQLCYQILDSKLVKSKKILLLSSINMK